MNSHIRNELPNLTCFQVLLERGGGTEQQVTPQLNILVMLIVNTSQAQLRGSVRECA